MPFRVRSRDRQHLQHSAHFSRAKIETSGTTIFCTIINGGNIMLYTPPKIAQDLGVPYHTLRQWS